METDESTLSFLNVLRASGLSGDPCSEVTIRDLEHRLGIRLPPGYRAFLIVAGRGFPAWEGSHYTVDDILGDQSWPALQLWGKVLLQRRGAHLPDGAFVFFIHQGAAVEFFLLDAGDNPAVFRWVDFEAPQPLKQVARSVTEHVLKQQRQLEEGVVR